MSHLALLGWPLAGSEAEESEVGAGEGAGVLLQHTHTCGSHSAFQTLCVLHLYEA